MEKNNNMTLDPMCIDMLKEVGNICSGNATVALSQVLNRRIELKIPDLKLLNADTVFNKLNNLQEILVGINIHLLGSLSGNVVLMFPEKSAYSLVDAVSQYRSELGNATEYGVSSLKEVGNIVISAYLATLSTFTKQVILHSTPSLICGTLETIFNVAFHGFRTVAQEIILIETFFEISENNIKGSFFLLFDPKTIKSLLEDTRGYWESEKKTN